MEERWRDRKGVGNKEKALRFSVVYGKNPLKKLKQRCDMIRFLSSERTTWLKHQEQHGGGQE